MSSLAKFFVVANLVLALAFLGTSATLFTTRKEWRATAEKMEQDNKTMKAEFKATNETNLGKIAQDNKNLQAKDQQITELKSANNSLNQTVTELKNDKSTLQSQVDTLNTQVGLKDKRLTDKDRVIADLTKQKDDLAKQNDQYKAERTDAVTKMAHAVLDKNQLADQLANLNKVLADTRSQLDDATITLNSYKKAGVPPPIDVNNPPKPIDGAVVAVKQDLGIAVLSVGSDDGVKEGDTFTVYRGQNYIGKVRVTKVMPDMAGAHIEYVNSPQAAVQVGDSASTSIGE